MDNKREIYRATGTIIVVESHPAEGAEGVVPATEIVVQQEEVASPVPAAQAEPEAPATQEMPATQETPAVQETPAAEAQPAPAAPAAGADRIEALEKKIEELTEALKESQHKDELVRMLHKEMEKYKGDFYASIRKPMVKAIINVHKVISNRLKDVRQELAKDELPDYQKLLYTMIDNVDFDKQAIEDTLEDEFNLTYFAPKPGDEYNPKEHNAIIVEDTDDEALAATVKELVEGGFKDSVSDKVFQKANIIVYKLNKK